MPESKKRPGPKAGSGRKPPTERQQKILDAYSENPNASAVAKAVNSHERHVRRIVHQFADVLTERRRLRYEERIQRIDARHAKAQDWADATFANALARLQELALSQNEGVALRASKMMLDLALEAPAVTSVVPSSDADVAVQRFQRRLVDQLSDVEAELELGGESA